MSPSPPRHGSRRNLKYDALILASADKGRAKDISIAINGQTAVGSPALAAADEIVKVGKYPTPTL